MSTLDASYRINDSEVIAESVDGELLIINLRNGTYYSSDGTGDQIWPLLAAHASLGDVVAWLSARYETALPLPPMSTARSHIIQSSAPAEKDGRSS